MSANITIEKKDNYLAIKSVGEREGFEDVLIGTQKIFELAQSHNENLVMIDCTELYYRQVSYPDAFNLVRYYESNLKEFRHISISVIGNPHNIEMLKYWESICEKRGYNFKVFLDEESAVVWLLNKDSLKNEE